MDIIGADWLVVQRIILVHIADRMWCQKYKQLERVYSFTTVIACLVVTCRLGIEFRTVNLILNKNLQRMPTVDLILELISKIDIYTVTLIYALALIDVVFLLIILDRQFTYASFVLKKDRTGKNGFPESLIDFCRFILFLRPI